MKFSKPFFLALLLGSAIGFAGALGVESGGYNYVPALTVTNNTPDQCVVRVPIDTRMCFDGQTGADYWSVFDAGTISTMSNLDVAGTITAGGGVIGANSIGAGALNMTDAGVNYIKSSTTAANASSSAAALTLAPINVLDANDLLVNIQMIQAGTSAFSVDLEGDGVFAGDVTVLDDFKCSSAAGTCRIGGRYTGGVHVAVQPNWQSGDTNLVTVFNVNNQDAGVITTTRFDGIQTLFGYRTGDTASGLVLQNGTATTPGTSIRWEPNSGTAQRWIMGMATGSNDYITGSTAGALCIGSQGSSNKPIQISTSGLGDVDFEFATNGDFTADGNVTGANLSGTNTGNVSLAAIGSSPNANGASLSGQALTLQPASASFGGVVTTGTQTFAGAKTFNAQMSAGVGIRINTTATAKPSCASGNRGEIYYVPGGALVADTMEVCAKNSSDAYAWISMATIP